MMLQFCKFHRSPWTLFMYNNEHMYAPETSPCCYPKSCPFNSEIFFMSLKQGLETYCVCSYSSSSFLTLNLFIAFFKDGQIGFYKTVGYDKPAYLVVHHGLIFFSFWVGQPLFGWVKVVWGLTKNPVGNNHRLYCKWV